MAVLKKTGLVMGSVDAVGGYLAVCSGYRR